MSWGPLGAPGEGAGSPHEYSDPGPAGDGYCRFCGFHRIAWWHGPVWRD